ncbi:hypothetical protein [Candidatus Finniella inopinata]|uniref:Uncharacterized protein n=1 Tax=Candidatus Finniella inopinata TaxID=1696036 RepID=A0A4Q7DGZ1_9PROT|nr:hypothetical protein [Candidatus Finniella inopinata]RZI46053.1 hypothetical protein EQU50_03730 [Candidatus Finniella inopinata]
MKVLSFIILCLIQNLYAANPSIVSLQQREGILLEQWHQQQSQIGKVLHRLRQRQFSTHHIHMVCFKNLKALVHQNLAMRSLEGPFRNQNEQIIKLCNDIAQVRRELKTLLGR